jgi:hypothetical protein
MTPAERQLVTDLFDRLATLEDAQRDPDAERVIRDGLAQAPNAVYALVQTALVQDDALRQANARIEELEGQLGIGNAQRQGGGGFLDNMRDSIFGRRDEQRGSVPSVRPGDAPREAPTGAPMGAPPAFGGPGQPMGGPGYGAPGQMQPPPEPQGGRGGSFLGTAAAAAAGVIGGSMLLDGIRSMTGNRSGSGHGIADQANAAGGSPWGNSGGSGGGGDLARQAGLDDVGRGSGAGPFGQSQGTQGQGAFNDSSAGKSGDADTAAYENAHAEDENLDDDDAGYEDGGDFDSGNE